MAMTIFGRKGFWDRAEYLGVASGAVLSLATAMIPTAYKGTTAIPAVVVAFMVCFAKFRSKRIEEKEKEEKADQDLLVREAHRQEIEQLRLALEAEIARQGEELERSKASKMELAARAASAILDQFHRRYFADEAKDETYKHRVTLFRCVEIDGDAGREKRLEIFAREGVHQDSRRWWALDDNDPEKCQGIAGQIWFHGVVRVVTAACEWPRDGNEVQIASYASSLNMTVDAARALNVKSRTFTGARIMVGGQKWGVLLLDSLKEGHITDKAAKKRLLTDCVELLGTVFTKVLT